MLLATNKLSVATYALQKWGFSCSDKSATFNTWRREKQITTDHEDYIKMTSRTKHHDSNEYENAPRLRYTLNSQASIGFVDNL